MNTLTNPFAEKTTLEPSPWEGINLSPEEPPTGLLNDVKQFIRERVHLTEEQLLVVSLYIFFSWEFKAHEHAPRLLFFSPEKACGKTTALETVALLTSRSPSSPPPSFHTNPTEAVIFRSIDAEPLQPLFLEECDLLFKTTGNDGIRAILNDGFRKGATVQRNVPTKAGGFTLQNFACHSLVAMAGIGTCLPETLLSRSLPVLLHRKPPDVQLKATTNRDGITTLDDAANLRWRLCSNTHRTWAKGSYDGDLDVSDRTFDVCRPLLAIAAKLDCLEEAKRALLKVTKDSELAASDDGTNVIDLVIQAFNDPHLIPGEETPYRFIPTLKLVEWLNNHINLEGRNDEDKGRALSNAMKPYGLTKRQQRHDGGRHYGYLWKDVSEKSRGYQQALKQELADHFPNDQDKQDKQDKPLFTRVSSVLVPSVVLVPNETNTETETNNAQETGTQRTGSPASNQARTSPHRGLQTQAVDCLTEEDETGSDTCWRCGRECHALNTEGQREHPCCKLNEAVLGMKECRSCYAAEAAQRRQGWAATQAHDEADNEGTEDPDLDTETHGMHYEHPKNTCKH
jgi:hypothetical protein